MDIFNTIWNGLITLVGKMSELANWVTNTSFTIPWLYEVYEPPTEVGGYGQLYTQFGTKDVSVLFVLTGGIVVFLTVVLIFKLIKFVLEAIPVA